MFIQAERNYDIYERELLAVVKALKHWRHHLGGSRFPLYSRNRPHQPSILEGTQRS